MTEKKNAPKALPTEEQRKARRKAMMLLEYKNRTEKELADRLAQDGFSEEAAEDAMEYVRSYGYINDKRYAASYIFSRMNQKSKNKILQELQQKGVDREIAAAAWEETAEAQERDEREVLRRTIAKKYQPGTSLDEKELRRLYGFLVRRGFQYGDIAGVLNEMGIDRMFE